jgi:hypothetical protein
LVDKERTKGHTGVKRQRILQDIVEGYSLTEETNPDMSGLDRLAHDRYSAAAEGWLAEMRGQRPGRPTLSELEDRLDVLEYEIDCWTGIIKKEKNLSAEERQDLIDTRDELVRWKKELKTMKKVKGSRGAGPTISRRPSRKR